ncbi:2-hydroxyacid dehydrogenase [Natronogracilivirga saccharolytica]|uniref:2-hydroxyacid dehydrogenase n=1 Tax=Natronogracilivirga saccharolytica TaxID=2812953 RepID=A0A8J7S7Q1_9BACT|nr:2-hydroxyacid dehydrogenase [Natronogracilivirga saccharolytica]MBP3193513.1 2-hydroxyacid dehydrogenase [Natronogracilivirga saccharolytica]
MKIAFFTAKSYDKYYFNQQLSGTSHEITYFEDALNTETAVLTRGFDAVCVFVNNQVDRETIELIAGYGVKAVALRSAGVNNIDLQAADDAGLHVFRVPAYSPEAVAEHTAALILTLNRKTHKAYNRVRENNFSLESLTGFNIHGKAVGVIGTGKIGVAFCRIMRGMGCTINAFDPWQNEEVIEMGGKYMELDELLANSNIISLHCPLMHETKHIIDKQAIDKMNNSPMLINTSRGALINTADVIEGLKEKKIGSLGIDVYEQEEHIFFQDLSEQVIEDDEIARLMAFPNVLITGHQAFLTKEALNEIAKTTLNNLSAFEAGEEVENRVRP